MQVEQALREKQALQAELQGNQQGLAGQLAQLRHMLSQPPDFSLAEFQQLSAAAGAAQVWCS
jgi:hypothetical protein